jgi:hypothetical protein
MKNQRERTYGRVLSTRITIAVAPWLNRPHPPTPNGLGYLIVVVWQHPSTMAVMVFCEI